MANTPLIIHHVHHTLTRSAPCWPSINTKYVYKLKDTSFHETLRGCLETWCQRHEMTHANDHISASCSHSQAFDTLSSDLCREDHPFPSEDDRRADLFSQGS